MHDVAECKRCGCDLLMQFEVCNKEMQRISRMGLKNYCYNCSDMLLSSQAFAENIKELEGSENNENNEN